LAWFRCQTFHEPNLIIRIKAEFMIQMANLSCTLVYKSDIKYFVRSLKKLGIFFPLGFSSAAIKISINSALI
ncbi:MAG: hypothetical protein MI923_23410, partial [Phycisphaerales bacterium]|nr:hypothetical protein [Phycisphaerales bacterium]